MKLYDLCIVKQNTEYPEISGIYAIILEDCGVYFLTEVWDFTKEEVRVLGISKNNLRLATKEEEEEYMKKFNEYIADWQDNKT
ncbi:hypothetical protein BPO_p0038 (plasmid) [Bergeyella porcorum]|uniref:Uncharacterized protein n=1 Tax=Bergeyella porcorum TaxID=1735111 RepID=A0AAU0F2W5_9FLAO